MPTTYLLAVVVLCHVLLAGYVYVDARRSGMSPRRWAVVALLVPFFGPLAYLFERDDRSYDPAADPYAQGAYNVHESREAERGPLSDSEDDS